MIKANTDYKVEGYTNRWTVIDTYKSYCLLENNTYGDETCYLVVSKYAPVEMREYTLRGTGEKIMLPCIKKVICETYDDIYTALNDEGIFI